ncbi:MAG: hypothetical protein QNK34_01115 [Woeseiaceae bacterium]|nr:hypothetical protein [Woeseiaceae bacterium]
MASNNRTKRIWTAIAGSLLIILVLLAHQYLPSQVSDLAHRIIRSLHGPGFGLVALIIMMLTRDPERPLVGYVKAAAFSIILAGVAEASQILGPREAQISDFLTDALGILGFLGIVAVLDRGVRSTIGRPRTVLLALIGIPALILTLMPTLWLSYALVKRSQSVPQLLSFDEAWEQTYSSGKDAGLEIIPAPDGWPEGSGNIARLHSSGRWGLMLHIRPDPDWSDYSAVSFLAATSGEESQYISVGLWGITPNDGTLQGRYYTSITVRPDPARFCISFDDLNKPTSQRKFDLTQVYELLLGSTNRDTDEKLLVDDFRLEKTLENCP